MDKYRKRSFVGAVEAVEAVEAVDEVADEVSEVGVDALEPSERVGHRDSWLGWSCVAAVQVTVPCADTPVGSGDHLLRLGRGVDHEIVHARLSGRIPKKTHAEASSPEFGLVGS